MIMDVAIEHRRQELIQRLKEERDIGDGMTAQVRDDGAVWLWTPGGTVTRLSPEALYKLQVIWGEMRELRETR